MKKQMKSLMLMAAAAVAFAGCAKEYVSEQPTSGTKLVDVKFNAEIPAYQTTKSTIDVNDLTFTSRWANGDRMGLKYEAMSDNAIVDIDNKLAEFSSSDASFLVKEMESCTGEWTYYGYFPYQPAQAADNSVSVPFGSQRVQDGNAINSQYDVMYADKLNFAKADAGLTGVTGEGKPVSFQMNRVTSLLHFHFTSSLDEPVVKATLTAEGDPIAAKNLELHYFAENDYKAGDILTDETFNKIELTFTNAPSATDFTLWFNILPYEKNGIENIRLVVETENKTMTFLNPNNDNDFILYEVGQIHTVSAVIPDSAWKDKTPPVTTPVYEKVTSALTDWSGDYLIVYEDASSKTPSPVAFDGSLTKLDQTSNTKSVAISDNKIEATTEMDAISFTIAAIDGGYSIQSASGVYIGRSSYSNGLDEKTSALVNTISYSNNAIVIYGDGEKDGSLVSLRFNKTSGQNRFRYFTSTQQPIALYKRSEALPVAPYITLSSESTSVAADATSASFDVKSNVSWNVSTDADWVTLETTSGSNDGTVKLAFSANEDAEDRTATIIVKSIDEGLSRVYSLTQKSAGSSDEEIAGTLCSWSFTSSSYPANKEDFIASEGSCGKSSLYLNGTGSTWNATRDSWAFTAITDMTINVVVNKKLKAGKKVTLSLDSFYNKAKNAPMKGFSLSVSAGVLDKNSWTLSTTSATYTVVCTLSKDVEPNETLKFTLTQTGKVGAGQGYMSNVKVLYE